MAKSVVRLVGISTNRCLLTPKYPITLSAVLQCRAQCSQPSLRCFSQSARFLSPRHRASRDGYPGFRNESKERRNVREHNLFDPQLQYAESVEYSPSSLHPTDYAQPVKRPPGTLPLEDTPSSELERELLYLSSQYPADPRVRNILLHLLYDKVQPPNAIQYEALVLANTSPEYGSADNLHNLIEEMERQDIPTNVNLYLAILRTLVVHPDVGVLSDVIEACENQWIEIDSEMRHLICAIYLRAGMQEVALDYLEQIEYSNGGLTFGIPRAGLQRWKAELWIHVLFIQYLAQHNDWEGVMRMCYRLYDDTSYGIPLASRHLDIPYKFWHSLLDQASSARDRWVTFWIWENWVLKAWIHPSRETCLRVLEICAENGAIRIAETVCIILRFLSKERSQQSPGLKDEKQPQTHQQFDTAKALLAKTYENAQPNEPRPSQTDIRRITAEWWVFDVEDKIGWGTGRAEPTRTLRINPWATLREATDPGLAWARKVDQREAVLQKREEREALRQAHVRRAKIEAGYASMRRSLPAPLIADIEKAANAELNIEETTNNVPEQSTPQPAAKRKREDKVSRPKIRLIGSRTLKTDQPIANARIKEWLKLGLDNETAVKMDDQMGYRAWKLDDDGSPDEVKPDTINIPSKYRTLQVRLSKLPEVSPDKRWYPEWSQMLEARRRYELAVERKRQMEKAKESMNRKDDRSPAAMRSVENEKKRTRYTPMTRTRSEDSNGGKTK